MSFTLSVTDAETGKEHTLELEKRELLCAVVAPAFGAVDDGEWSWEMQETPEGKQRLDQIQAFLVDLHRAIYPS